MAVPRTPRPPIIVPKPARRAPDLDEIERWVARLARSIRLQRLERDFLRGGARSGDADGGSERH
jgi:hypothetical protein